MKKIVLISCCSLFSVSAVLANSPIVYDLFTISDDLPDDRGIVFHFQAIQDSNGNLLGAKMPMSNPLVDCDSYISTQDFEKEFVTMKYQTSVKDENQQCSYSGKQIINIGLYDRGVSQRTDLPQIGVIPIWMDYLVNGINDSRSKHVDLDLVFNKETQRWQVQDRETAQTVKAIHFVSNYLLRLKVIGIKNHEFSF